MNRPNRKSTIDLGHPTEPHGRIPAFASIEEEAAFWDTHDLTDFLDESRPMQMTVSPTVLSETTMSVRLPENTLKRLRQRAAQKGLGHTSLARMWIMERLEQEEQAKATKR